MFDFFMVDKNSLDINSTDFLVEVSEASNPKHLDWLKTPSSNGYSLNNFSEKIILSSLLEKMIGLYGWLGASSQNVWWDYTKKPLSVIRVPEPEGDNYITLFSPKIISFPDQLYDSLEGCAALPGKAYLVPRPVELGIEADIYKDGSFHKVVLDYVSDINLDSDYTPLSLDTRSAIVMHEIEHLEGILISEQGIEVPLEK